MTETNETAAVDVLTDGDNTEFENPSLEDDSIAQHELERMDVIRRFENGMYPYQDRIKTSDYEKDKALLQVELLKVQKWVKDSGKKVVVLFEGRDAAGKGGAIKRFMEHLNPRVGTGRGTGETHGCRADPMVFPALYQPPALGR